MGMGDIMCVCGCVCGCVCVWGGGGSWVKVLTVHVIKALELERNEIHKYDIIT